MLFIRCSKKGEYSQSNIINIPIGFASHFHCVAFIAIAERTLKGTRIHLFARGNKRGQEGEREGKHRRGDEPRGINDRIPHMLEKIDIKASSLYRD